jgi:hypothetical protein
MSKRYTFNSMLGATVLLLASPTLLTAWVGPTAAPPGNNVSAPINIGNSEQFKPSVIGANIFNIYGASQYLNFGNATGASGYGIRNNGGVLEFKNSGGSWGPLYSSQWGSSGSSLFYNSGNVGIGTISPNAKLHIYDSTAVVGHPALRLEGAMGGYGAGLARIMHQGDLRSG